MITRRSLIGSGLALPAAAMLPGRARAVGAPEVADNGLHFQPWFHESFLELGDDLAEAKSTGKHLAVLFEQRGCPYCREMHRVNLVKPEIVEYLKKNWLIVQLDMWGSRMVTDFDGQSMEEKDLAKRWRVMFTPTIAMFRSDMDVAGKSGKDLEAARMPGYFKPFHFISMFEYVEQDQYDKVQFQRFLQAKFDRLKEQGKQPDIW